LSICHRQTAANNENEEVIDVGTAKSLHQEMFVHRLEMAKQVNRSKVRASLEKEIQIKMLPIDQAQTRMPERR
tara:strand:+ start:363 stop:581 length:219 start_codon:yes stop_codon:yes gene_type:complete